MKGFQQRGWVGPASITEATGRSAPSDGLFDDREETFAVKLPSLVAGPHTIAVRATDEEGNVGAEKIAVTAK